MKKSLLFLVAWFLIGQAFAQYTCQTPTFLVEIDAKGRVVKLLDQKRATNYAPADQPGALIRMRGLDKKELAPEKMVAGKGILRFEFGNGAALHVKVTEKETHLRFELIKVVNGALVDAVIWGPFNTTIADTIGEVVGVVRNGDFALGIQALNPKTVGGKLLNDDGSSPSFAGITGTAAAPEPFGSSLQAFCINASLTRTIDYMQYRNCTVDPIKGYTLEGSAIALFGVNTPEALPTIGRISQAEGLPYEEIDGQWIRTSPLRNRPYLITGFTEENFDEMLELTKRLGFHCIYHEHPFENWGHFELIKSEFPHGRAGLRACVEKARKAGIIVGVHTLSNFITTNDPFVTTPANSNLQAVGTTKLTGSITETTAEIPLADPQPFEQQSTLNCVLIGNEIIRYQEVSKEKPWRLLNCVRGQYGTAAAAYPAGTEVRRLADHGYKTLFPDWTMQEKMIANLADLFNETGVAQLDFDGHEGLLCTGHGDYGTNYYVDEFLKRVEHPVYNGSSIMNHYYWHNNSYINWGEPWYASFRESQADHRFRLQPFFERNYMPNMLGWFLVTPSTAVEDVEWMMSVSAGYNAGFALVLSHEAYKTNPDIDRIIQTIALWQEAKRKGLFPAEQRALLKDTRNDFHLERLSDKEWTLQHFQKFRFEHRSQQLQPGQSNYSIWTFENAGKTQPIRLQLTLEGAGARAENPEATVDGYFTVTFPLVLEQGQTLVWDGSSQAKVYSDKGKFLRAIQLERSLPELKSGVHRIDVGARKMDGEEAVIRGVVRLEGEVELLRG